MTNGENTNLTSHNAIDNPIIPHPHFPVSAQAATEGKAKQLRIYRQPLPDDLLDAPRNSVAKVWNVFGFDVRMIKEDEHELGFAPHFCVRETVSPAKLFFTPGRQLIPIPILARFHGFPDQVAAEARHGRLRRPGHPTKGLPDRRFQRHKRTLIKHRCTPMIDFNRRVSDVIHSVNGTEWGRDASVPLDLIIY